jgi:site-specific DNA recombinase
LGNIYTDSGISAKKDSTRPQFARLMEDAKAGHFDVVIVDKIDRFYRHLNGLLNALDQLNNQKVTFVSVQERIDFTTPWGKLTLTMLGMLAEIYIDNLRQETQKGKLQRARDGWWNGNIPLGYCRGLCSKCGDPNGPGYCPEVGKPDKSDGRMLVAHPIDSQAVKLAFNLYLHEIQNDVMIAEKLNQTTFTLPDGTRQAYRQKGIPGRKGPRMYTKDFVRGMLTQVFYTGKVAYYGRGRKRQIESLFPGKHPALVSEDDFQRTVEVRKMFARIGQSRNKKIPRVYPLTGIIFCGKCGWPMRGMPMGPTAIYTYRDSGQIERSGLCDQPCVRAIPLERQVIELLHQAMLVWGKSVRPELVAKHIEETNGQLQRAYELYIRGEITKEIVMREKERVEQIIKPWQEDNFADTQTLVEKLQSAYDNWDRIKTFDQKRFFQLALERIFVRDHEIVAIQPTPVFLPVMTVFQQGSDQQSNHGVELLTPGLKALEALTILEYRTKRDLK